MLRQQPREEWLLEECILGEVIREPEVDEGVQEREEVLPAVIARTHDGPGVTVAGRLHPRCVSEAVFELEEETVVLGPGFEGWSTVLLSLWFLGGLTILSLGIVGVYVGRIFYEVKQRPSTVIRRIYN